MSMPDDAAEISSVLHASFAAYESLYTPEAFEATVPTPEQINARLNEGPVWIAVRDGIVAGTVSAMLKREGLYIRSMAVLPTARGQGIASLLLKQIERSALDHHCKRMFLSTTPFLKDAIRLYERWGFRRNDEPPHELYGTPLFTMVKALNGRGKKYE